MLLDNAQRRTRLEFVCAAFMLLCTVTGCVPVMTQPPPAHEDGGADRRLVGTWLSGNEEPGFAFIGEDGGTMRAALVSVLENGRLEVDEFTFYRAASDAIDLLMVKDDGGDGEGDRYFPIRYRLEEHDRFHIDWLSLERVKDAVARGELAGRVVKGRWIDDVIITAPYAAAIAWIEGHDDVWDTEHAIQFERLDLERYGCMVVDEGCPEASEN